LNTTALSRDVIDVQRNISMQTVKIYRLTHLSPTLFGRLKAAQMEAAQVWNSSTKRVKYPLL
jgi:hypothetical protein